MSQAHNIGLEGGDHATAIDEVAKWRRPDRDNAGQVRFAACDYAIVSVLAITELAPGAILIAKANAGAPRMDGEHLHDSGSPELMERYAALAICAGARIVGGCCGNTPGALLVSPPPPGGVGRRRRSREGG